MSIYVLKAPEELEANRSKLDHRRLLYRAGFLGEIDNEDGVCRPTNHLYHLVEMHEQS